MRKAFSPILEEQLKRAVGTADVRVDESYKDAPSDVILPPGMDDRSLVAKDCCCSPDDPKGERGGWFAKPSEGGNGGAEMCKPHDGGAPRSLGGKLGREQASLSCIGPVSDAGFKSVSDQYVRPVSSTVSSQSMSQCLFIVPGTVHVTMSCRMHSVISDAQS